MAAQEGSPETSTAEIGRSGRVTLRDIAEAVGVSISTASRALSGAPGISGDVRSQIQLAAERLNYAGAAIGTAAVISDLEHVDNNAGEFMLAVQRGMAKRARELGLSLSIKLAGPSRMAWSAGDDAMAGYLLLHMEREDIIEHLAARSIPAVIVNGREPLMRLDAVAPANRTGGYLGARHLITLGHRRILMLAHSPRATIRDRMAGSRWAMEEAGLEVAGDGIIDLEAMRTNLAYNAVKQRLDAKRGPDFTAVLCCNDACAVGAMAALSEGGLDVPRDVSVVGFDDIPTAALNSVPLTTIHVQAEDVGARSVSRLMERIRSQDSLATYTETAVELVVRASTGPARK